MDLESVTVQSDYSHRYEPEDDVVLHQQPLNIYLADELFNLRGNEFAVAATNCEQNKLKGDRAKHEKVHVANYMFLFHRKTSPTSNV